MKLAGTSYIELPCYHPSNIPTILDLATLIIPDSLNMMRKFGSVNAHFQCVFGKYVGLHSPCTKMYPCTNMYCI